MCAMHLEKAFLSTTNYGSKGKKPANTAKLRAATAKHEAWLKKQGLHPEQRELKKAFTGQFKFDIPDYSIEDTVPLGNNLHVDGGRKTGIMANLHKESKEVQQQIMDKASRCVPQYNKGGYAYTTPETDITTLGSKSRRG